MEKRKILLLICTIAILSIIALGCDFAPGSYPYAEHYELNISEDFAIKTVQNFKKNNPQFNVPEKTQLDDGRGGNDGGHWYHVYFYYPKENQIIHTWIRSEEKGKITFGFVGVNAGLTLGNWKEINKDFSYPENALQKKKFEERILNPIKSSLGI
jgi:hypothetical protein